MFNNPRIHLYNKIVCMLLTYLVIIFNYSSISLLLMFIIYFMLIKNDDKIYSMIISLFFVGAFALLYIYDVTFWVKLILIVAYTYYYLYLDISKVKFRKKKVVKEITKEDIKEEVEEKVKEELENGNNLTDEDKKEIEDNLEKKVEAEYLEIKGNHFLRYYQVQQRLGRKRYRLDMENMMYIFVNILALVICVLVARI